MKIAVIFENDKVYQHFGHCHYVKLYTFDDGMMMDMKIEELNGEGHNLVVDFMLANGVDTVICGGIGAPAVQLLANKGIELCSGVQGNADQAVMDYLMGRLKCYADPACAYCHEHSGGCGGNCKE